MHDTNCIPLPVELRSVAKAGPVGAYAELERRQQAPSHIEPVRGETSLVLIIVAALLAQAPDPPLSCPLPTLVPNHQSSDDNFGDPSSQQSDPLAAMHGTI